MSRPWVLLLLMAVSGTWGCSSKPPFEGKSVTQLEQMLKNADPVVQSQGAFGLARLGQDAKPAMPSLIQALKGDARVRQYAAQALGNIGPEAKDAVPALIILLRDPEWPVRRQSAISLGQVGTDAQAAISALESLRQDREGVVRKAAEQSLQQIRGTKAK